jgi:hypothetical protein
VPSGGKSTEKIPARSHTRNATPRYCWIVCWKGGITLVLQRPQKMLAGGTRLRGIPRIARRRPPLVIFYHAQRRADGRIHSLMPNEANRGVGRNGEMGKARLRLAHSPVNFWQAPCRSALRGGRGRSGCGAGLCSDRGRANSAHSTTLSGRMTPLPSPERTHASLAPLGLSALN